MSLRKTNYTTKYILSEFKFQIFPIIFWTLIQNSLNLTISLQIDARRLNEWTQFSSVYYTTNINVHKRLHEQIDLYYSIKKCLIRKLFENSIFLFWTNNKTLNYKLLFLFFVTGMYLVLSLLNLSQWLYYDMFDISDAD